MYLKRSLVVIYIILISVFLHACGGGGSAPQTGNIELVNNNTVAIDEFYVAPTTSSTWGNNLLTAPLPSNYSQTFYNFTPKYYDASTVVNGYYSTYYSYLYDFYVAANSTYTITTYDNSYTGSILVTNNTIGSYILEVYISPVASSTWGPNQLNAPIAPGGYMEFTNFVPGDYDILVVWSVGADTITTANVESLTLTNVPVN